jgi:glycosyl hydrolase family 106( putative alpha-L-rhamnosidase)
VRGATPTRARRVGSSAARLLLIVASALAARPPAAAQEDPLADAFARPPDSARLRMYWRVFGPAWQEDETDFELAELKRAGVGGAVAYFLYPVVLDDRARGIVNQRFLSPEFLSTFRHAAERARELGLRFSVNGGTGWPYGGPAVAPADAAQRLRVESIAPGRDGAATPPKLADGERLVFAALDGRDVTEALRTGGVASPTGAPLALFIAGPTGMEVKRAALGGEGRVVDHLSRAPLERWLDANVAPLLESGGDRGRPREPLVQSIGCDSLEVYGANWCDALPAEFARRRGYDLLPMLTRWADARDSLAPGLRFDFWRTVAELAEEEFVEPLANWSHQHGVALELEAYGTPPLPLTAARSIDVPTGEHYEWKALSVARLAASGAHLCGRRTIGAEAWTWAGIPNRLADTLGDLKLLSDFHFLSGANDLVGVDFPYSPRSAGAPGWLPYYGPCFNWNHPQWPFFQAFADYVARCQLLLREGRPVADVLVWLPVEDCFARGGTDQMLLDFALRDHFVTGRPTTEFGLKNALTHHSNLIHALLTHGLDFDAVDFWALDRLAKVEEGALAIGGGRYTTLVLHDVERIEAAALERIVEFARRGGRVIATRRLPERAAGLRGPEVQERFQARIVELFGEEVVRASRDPALLARGVRLEHDCGRGSACFASDDAAKFVEALAPCEPRVRIEPWSPQIAFVERELEGRDLFFFVNAGERAASFHASLRSRFAGGHAERWQPLDGTIDRLPAVSNTDLRIEVALELPARGSIFVVVDPSLEGHWPPQPPPPPPTRRALAGPWHVTFDGPDAPPPRDVATLDSWSEWPDAKSFSGRATYATDFTLADPPPRRATLRLPEVRDACEVRVNGRSAGVLFTPPFEAELAPLLKSGTNRLEITVANLPVNRFVSLPDADLAALRREFGNRFPAPEEKRLVTSPLPSGLIGTVELETVGAAADRR